jgi:hypothetical protein
MELLTDFISFVATSSSSSLVLNRQSSFTIRIPFIPAVIPVMIVFCQIIVASEYSLFHIIYIYLVLKSSNTDNYSDHVS